MFANLIGVIVAIIAFAGAGFLSYTYLEKDFGPRQAVLPEASEALSGVPPLTVPSAVLPATPVVPPTTPTTPSKANGSLVAKATTTKKTVVAPSPLRVQTGATPLSKQAVLSARKVIEYTNGARSQNGGLPALVENELLGRDAQIKLDDMFARQYFEHESPTGRGPGDLADIVGYAYVVVGENLALGDFESDEKLVLAWMNSPGHRANILNAHFQEIGVAVGKGMFNGRETWLAVQEFGMPLSACPALDAEVKTAIDTNNAEIYRLRTLLEAKRLQIDATSQADPHYSVYVDEFNALVREYNPIVERNRALVATYNASVQEFNSCVAEGAAH